jgi:hypothetical protein
MFQAGKEYSVCCSAPFAGIFVGRGSSRRRELDDARDARASILGQRICRLLAAGACTSVTSGWASDFAYLA